MCGRYTLTSPEEIAARFGLGALAVTRIEPRFNVSSSQCVPAIRSQGDGPVLEYMQWGFQPHWLRGLVRTRRFALGAVFVYQRTRLFRFEHGQDLRVGLKAFPKAA